MLTGGPQLLLILNITCNKAVHFKIIKMKYVRIPWMLLFLGEVIL